MAAIGQSAKGEVQMNNQMIISIGRECGSGGHELGELLAAHYGIRLYDRNIITELAEEMHEDAGKLAKREERVGGMMHPFIRRNGFAARQGEIGDKFTKEDRLYLEERGFIQRLAARESFVIVGRAANAILEGYPNTLRLYVYAPESFKLPRVRAEYGLKNDEEARKLMKKIDSERKAYFEYYSDMIWGSSDGHDLMINTSLLGIEETARQIEAIADLRFSCYQKTA